MKNLSSYIIRKMKLRKLMMIIFSSCSVLLICGILNFTQETGTEIQNNSISQHITVSDQPHQAPEETIFDKKDRKIRIYSAFALIMLMALSFIIDILFVRCPACSGHIQYAITPETCHNCGTSFCRKENEK